MNIQSARISVAFQTFMSEAQAQAQAWATLCQELEWANALDEKTGEFRKKGIKAKTLVVPGAIVAEIINAAEREGADLIAIASHGRTGLARVFYGSMAAGVLHRVDRSLLLVRSGRDE